MAQWDMGQLVGGRYRVERALGEGGAARAFLARDEVRATNVALKVARRRADGPLLGAEFELLRGLYHPNLAAALDLFVEAGRPVIVCEWVRGVPLATLSPAALPAVARELASAVALLHAMGIAHGDVKADNVLVEQGRARLLDLSAARRGAGVAHGFTRGQGAPETERSGEASFASDVFALARLLVEVGAPPELRSQLTDCLAVEPRARPSAAELAERLGADRAALARATLRSRFEGRGGELAQLAAVSSLGSPGAGAPRAVVVTGPAGIGKTRLLREGQWRAALGAPTFARQDGESLAELLARVFGGPAPRSLAEASQQVEREPSLVRVLVVDEVDLLPDGELAWLRALTARPELPIRWLLAARQLPPGLSSAIAELRLPPLDDRTVQHWIEGTGLEPARAREAAGNPRRLLELLWTRRAPGARRLGPAARRIVAALSAAGGAVDARKLAEQEPDASALEELLATGLVQREGAGFAAALDTSALTTPAERTGAHRALLASASTDVERLVHASLAGDHAAADRAMDALREDALAPSPELARAARRLALAPLPAARVFAAHVLERAGDARAAAAALLHAALRATPPERTQIALVLGRLLGRRGDPRGLRVLRHVEGALARLEESILLLKLGRFAEARDTAIAALAPHVSPEIARELEVSRALADSWLGDLETPVARLLALAESPDEGQAVTARSRFRVRSACATVLLRAGDAERARAFYAEALAEARSHGLDDLALSVTVNFAVACHQAGDYGRAHREYGRALDLARATAARPTLALVALYTARLYADLGLHARAQATLARLDVAALSPFHRGILRCLEAEAWAALGDPARARPLADDAVAAFAAAPRERTEASLVRLEIALGLEERELARELVARLEAEVAAPGTRDLAARWAELASRLAADEGRGHEAVRLARVALDQGTITGKRRLLARLHGRLATAYRAEGAPLAARPHDEAAQRLDEELRAELPAELRAPPASSAIASTAGAATGLLVAAGEGDARALVDAVLRVVRSPSAEEAHGVVIEEALRVTRAERGFLLLREREGDEPYVASARNVDREAIKKPRHKYGRSIAARAMMSGDSILLADAQSDADEGGDGAPVGRSLTAHRLGLRSVLCVPLLHEGATRGALYLDNRFARGAFGAADERAVRALVDALGAVLARFDRERQLRVELADAVRARAHPAERAPLAEPVGSVATTVSPFPELPTRSAPLLAVLGTLARVIDVDVPILVRGESGTGKELVARALHAHGARRSAPFVAINCGALPEALLEAELFGHTRGAFTGATHDKAGLFVAAKGGVVFLDEIGEMPPSMQVKLLRVLQEREVRPLGATHDVPVDVRVVSATHRDLRRAVAEGHFREDLYYRVAVVDVELPPLRERLEDIGPLADLFLGRLCQQSGLARTLSPSIRASLAQHRWPGNVRELENALVRAFFLADGAVIEVMPGLTGGPRSRPRSRRGDDERRMLEEALAREDWNVRKVARTLGIPRATFYRRLQLYGLERRPGA